MDAMEIWSEAMTAWCGGMPEGLHGNDRAAAAVISAHLPGDGDVEAVAKALAKADGLDFDEVCGVDANPDEGYCDSGTCVAAHWEEHDADQARRWYLHLARAAIAAMPKVDGWRDIASDPGIQSRLVFYNGDNGWGMVIAHFHEGVWRSYPSGIVDNVTHWMPLPPTPEPTNV